MERLNKGCGFDQAGVEREVDNQGRSTHLALLDPMEGVPKEGGGDPFSIGSRYWSILYFLLSLQLFFFYINSVLTELQGLRSYSAAVVKH